MSRSDELRRLLVRNVDEVELSRQVREPLYDSQSGSVTDGTAAKKLGAGFDILPPGKRSCPYHLHHAQEEMFVILQGEGTLRVAGEQVPVRAGDVIVIPAGPEYPHHLLNTSDAPMHYLSISTQEEPEICEYPDSGKYGAWANGFGVRHRTSEKLDYWDGEPLSDGAEPTAMPGRAGALAFWLLAAAVVPPVALAAASLGFALPARTPAADLTVLVLWSVCEEVVFRGALQPYLARHWRHWPDAARPAAALGLTPANVATSIAFAAAHVFRLGVAAAWLFPVSLLFGLARERSGRIWPAALLHVYCNAALYAASAWLGRAPG